jgi:hypothetical protein
LSFNRIVATKKTGNLILIRFPVLSKMNYKSLIVLTL